MLRSFFISKTDRVMGAPFPPSSIADTPWVGLHTQPKPLPAGRAELTSLWRRLLLILFLFKCQLLFMFGSEACCLVLFLFR